MKQILFICLASLFTITSFISHAAEPRQQATPQERARTVYIFHQPIVMLQAKFGLTTPEERVLRIRNTLRNFTEEDVRQPLKLVSVTRYNQPGKLIVMNGKPVMLLTEGDLDEGDDLTLDQAAQRVMARMEAQRTALRDQYNRSWLVLSAIKAVGGLLGLAALWYGAYRSWRRVKHLFRRRIIENRSWIPQSWRRFIGAIEARLYATLMILLGVIALYVWLSWVLSLFPWTRVWGASLGDWSVRVFQGIALAVVSALPGLMIVLIIFMLTAVILKLLKVVLNQVAAGRLQLPGIHPETVGATRKLIAVVVWLFALSAAYPFLPGANSLAFKGISVFFGLMLTLGSAGVMNHAMSGLVLIYSRALRKGDVIRVADNEGLVSEIGMLATKIITRENYVVTVPNAVVVSGKITNLSAHAHGGGINLTISVTIGYDTPWRQVHAMLELAAKRASSVDPAQPPLVRQLSLMDWYIAYELQVQLKAGQSLAAARNELYSHIQDVFNEFNVQIMSPNYVMQPEGSVTVAKENWYSSPAVPPDGNKNVNA
ncbi:mechanosensitive ion channel family protein [Klebsiella quasipneumoniae]|uniref:mechanosensitive ion channel family protein n=1 Tax=Klebsiella quasipneumoniae TaxID=1463165 RepID=UPI0006513582|nr:mechanosensitive ion channel domain-containing protein [Klebsiella quasipneumoniae]AWX90175.1 mechanosensitive ion channel protein MscS [Klebsiella quasipneumoniae subsp. quasipneumoniae]KMH15259.1 mechanosensitive ion channel protein [Klebsiella quasipneumoniae subsp. quasipneumoniae]MBZ6707107.1 mechanosensitive ion channel [Klebsiella quasipneumoniae]MCH9293779.1 mechanosensitive ion channel family protein [Klebsiella quasipneumoniae]MCJ1825839.1 mechanosensitive ion channel [Klebsiella 